VIEGNVIIEWVNPEDHPWRCSLQGIGLFDGYYDNLTIINNVVSATQYHGISVHGARGAKIINNTVANTLGLVGKYPWIEVLPRRDGAPTTDVLVANNIAMSIQGIASDVDRIVFRNNSIVGIPSQVFENLAVFDYRPKASSGFIDTGDATVAPPTDVMGQKRPSGPLPDRGAYEVQGEAAPAPEPVLPVEGTAPPLDTTTDGSTSTGGTTTPPPDTTTGTTTGGSTSTGEPTTTVTSPGGAKSIRIKPGVSKKTSSLNPLTSQSTPQSRRTKQIELK
jgi:parallel beta-helix repeat protein